MDRLDRIFGYAPTAAGYAALTALYPNSVNLQTLQKYSPAAGAVKHGSGRRSELCPGMLTGMPRRAIQFRSVRLGFAGPCTTTLDTTNAIDFNISQKDQLRGRYIWEKYDAPDTAAQIPYLLRYVAGPVSTCSRLANTTPFRRASATNSVSDINRYYNVYSVPDIQYPGLAMFPNLTFDDLNGVNVGPDPNAPQGAVQNTYQGVDNLSWVKGKHNLKFGAEFRDIISPQQFTQRVRGDYEYSDLALFATDGAPDTFGERSTGNITYYGNQKAFYAYGADTWRVMPTLSLNSGFAL